jgi:Co/Zn/Cd efflux system component
MEVHDFHVWELRPSKFLLTAHVFSDKNREKYVLHELTTICRRYKIYHTTIQVEEWDQRQSDSYILCDNDIH